MDAPLVLLDPIYQGGWESVGGMVRSAYFQGDPERPGQEIATVPMWRDTVERHRIAQLLSAAPELLEALKAVKADAQPQGYVRKQTFAKVCKAIAKAERS